MPREQLPYTPSVFRFERAREVAERFEDLLRTLTISPVPGGSLERMTLSIYDILYHTRPGHSIDGTDIRPLFADMAGQAELAHQLLEVRNHPNFGELVPHLHLLNQGEAAQSRPARHSDAASNKIFELLAACYAMRCGSNVRLDHPEQSRGDNPDVLATIRGRRWGIACKVLHSLHPESVIQNIDKGLSQIDCSPAETGFVFLSLKNVLDRDKYWQLSNADEWQDGADPIFQTFIAPKIPLLLLQGDVTAIAKTVGDWVGDQYLRERFAKTRALGGVMLYAHIVCGVRVPSGKPVPMTLRLPTWAGLGHLGNDESVVLECINRVAQDIP